MPKVEINGVNLYYVEEGEGFPVFLIHAWPTDHAIWMFQLPVFSDHFRTIAVDLRGFGRSDKPKGAITIRQFSRDLAGLMDKLGIEKAHIAGISLGGAVAKQFALDYPERNQSSLQIGSVMTTERFMIEVDGRMRDVNELYLEELRYGYLNFWRKVWKANLSFFFNKEYARTPQGSYLIRYLFENRYARFNADPAAITSAVTSNLRWNVKHRMSESTLPTAIIVGDGDPTLSYCEEHHRLCPQAEYWVIGNSGHFCIIDQAQEFNEKALSFLKRNT
jgi:pimeloyl-ACP methyl ester carboxylesterase